MAVVRRSQKKLPRRRPPSRGRRTAKIQSPGDGHYLHLYITNPVWWGLGLMHAISNYRGGNRPNTHTNKQTTDRTDYNTLRRSSLARSVITTDVLRAHLWQVYWVYSSIVNWLHQQVRYLYAVASETICKWGGRMPARSAGRKIFDVPPHFSIVPPTWGGAQRLFVTDWETIEVVKSGEGQ